MTANMEKKIKELKEARKREQKNDAFISLLARRWETERPRLYLPVLFILVAAGFKAKFSSNPIAELRTNKHFDTSKRRHRTKKIFQRFIFWGGCNSK